MSSARSTIARLDRLNYPQRDKSGTGHSPPYGQWAIASKAPFGISASRWTMLRTERSGSGSPGQLSGPGDCPHVGWHHSSVIGAIKRERRNRFTGRRCLRKLASRLCSSLPAMNGSAGARLRQNTRYQMLLVHRGRAT